MSLLLLLAAFDLTVVLVIICFISLLLSGITHPLPLIWGDKPCSLVLFYLLNADYSLFLQQNYSILLPLTMSEIENLQRGEISGPVGIGAFWRSDQFR